MAKDRVVKSAIDAALNTAKKNADVAKEVMESTGKSATRATMIKNAVNSVQSNMSSGQAKAIANAGKDAAEIARREGIEAATSQVKARTAQVALNNHTYQGNPAIQKSKEFINNKRTNQVINSHNAKQRDVEMQTIVNNVKDRNINRIPKDHETAKNAVNKTNETVRNAHNTQNQNTTNNIFNAEYENNWRENSFQGKPVIGYNRDNYQMHTQNTEPQASPFLVNNRKLQNEVEFYEGKRTQTNDTGYGPTKESAERMNTIGGNTGGNTQNNKNTFEEAKSYFDKNAESLKNKSADFFLGGAIDSYNNYRSGIGIMESISKAHQNADGSVNMKRAVGTFVTASAAARVASGGGLYKDRYGNPNLIGVPFI